MIEAVFPVRRIMAVSVDMPDVLYAVLLEIAMHALADVNQTILVTAG